VPCRECVENRFELVPWSDFDQTYIAIRKDFDRSLENEVYNKWSRLCSIRLALTNLEYGADCRFGKDFSNGKVIFIRRTNYDNDEPVEMSKEAKEMHKLISDGALTLY
jgi:hypothetical protein